jgi:hypothetical protein
MRALDISSDNVASRTLLDHGQDLGKIATKDARNTAKQCAIFRVAENTVQILNQESSGGARGVPLQFDEGKGQLEALPFQAGRNVEELIPAGTNHFSINVDLVLN